MFQVVWFWPDHFSQKHKNYTCYFTDYLVTVWLTIENSTPIVIRSTKYVRSSKMLSFVLEVLLLGDGDLEWELDLFLFAGAPSVYYALNTKKTRVYSKSILSSVKYMKFTQINN